MKPLALNLSKVKKIAGDEHSSTFLHPAGHHIVVAHQGISNLQREQIKRMPIQKMADGGSAESEAPVTEDKNNISGDIHPMEWMKSLGNGAKEASSQDAYDKSMASLPTTPDQATGGVPVASSGLSTQNEVEQMLQKNPQVQSPLADVDQPGNEVQTSAPAPDSLTPIQNGFQQSYEQGQRAISEQQKIDEAKAKANLAVQDADLIARKKLNEDAAGYQKAFMEQQQHFLKDYQAEHINPRHYQESMTSGQKVATGIGLFLGGMSTAFTHQGNPAMEFLQKQIDRDIRAQEASMDQKKTIMGANQAIFHDQMMSNNQTRVNMNDIYDHQIQQAALKLGTPQAKANADAAHAHFAMQNQGLLQQNAMRATIMQHLKTGGGAGLSAMDLSNAGFMPQAEAAKEQASIDAQKTAIMKTKELYEAMNKEQTAGNLLNPMSSRRVDAMKAELVNAVMNASASKRLTHESIKAEIEPLEIKTTDDEKTRRTKMDGMINIIQRHADPTPYMKQYAPGALPQYQQAPQEHTLEGKTATGPNGQKIIMKNGQWVAHGQ